MNPLPYISSAAQYAQRNKAKTAAAALIALAALIVVYKLRALGIIRGPFMLAYRHPMLVSLPLLIGVVSLAATVGLRHRRGLMSKTRTVTKQDRYGFGSSTTETISVPLARRLRTPLIVAAVSVTVALTFASIFTGVFTQASIADNTVYETADPATLQGGTVRLTPKEVAKTQINQASDSATEKSTNQHAVIVDGKFLWTAARDPQGMLNEYRKPSRGAISVDGDASTPKLNVHGKPYDAKFKYGPGMKISQNIKWQINTKHCFTCDVQEVVALPTDTGPVYMASIVKYKGGLGGLLVRRPYFAGVFLIYPSGKIERLSPEQARQNALVAGSGRMFPEKLAKRIADAYKYRKGVMNRIFTHEEHYDIQDTSGNKQPYLQDFKTLGPQWVTTMRPRKKQTTGLVLLTDARTGQTRAWKPQTDTPLIGNDKAIDTVIGTRLGVVFAGAGASDAKGKYRAVEPRQVFIDGKLHFMVSVIPDSAQRTEMTAIVAPQTPGAVVKVFPSSQAGDRALINYLSTGQSDPAYDCATGCPTDFADALNDEQDTDPAGGLAQSAPDVKLPQGTDARSTLTRLLERNRRDQRTTTDRLGDLKAQERDLERLLNAASGR